MKLQRNALSVIEGPARDLENQSKSFLSASSLSQFNSKPQRKLVIYLSFSLSLSVEIKCLFLLILQTVDMSKLGAVSLWRYWRYFKLVS